jgi:hypothetical protein
MRSWQELLSHYGVVKNHDMGPFTGQLASAIVALQDAAWFEHAGAPLPAQSGAVAASSWAAVLAIFDDDPHYSSLGHLSAPELAVNVSIDEHNDRVPWIARAYDLARDTVSVAALLPQVLPVPDKILLGDHVHMYFRYLLIEIGTQDVNPCTYFREQLAWWHAGHVPCGWSGEWPLGQHRVY